MLNKKLTRNNRMGHYTLTKKYKIEDAKMNKFIVVKFIDFKMVDS